jgi:RNA polymerase sigma-70 factor, ECF subfamily
MMENPKSPNCSRLPPDDGGKVDLSAMIRKHLPALHARVQKNLSPQLRGKAETSDFVQDAMIKFLTHAPRFSLQDDGSLRALLFKIVDNVIHDKYDWFSARRRAIALERPLPPDTILELDPPQRSNGHTPSTAASDSEREGWVRFGVELLTAEDQRVIVMRDWDKESYEAIGEQLGYSADTAKRRYSRALIRLSDIVLMLRHGRIDELVDDHIVGESKE